MRHMKPLDALREATRRIMKGHATLYVRLRDALREAARRIMKGRATLCDVQKWASYFLLRE